MTPKLIQRVEAELQAATGGEWVLTTDGYVVITAPYGRKTICHPVSGNVRDSNLIAHSGGSNGYVAQLLALCKTLAAGVRAGHNVRDAEDAGL